jgi:hypothetical protein
MLWWNTTDSLLYIYYNDGTSAQFVQTSIEEAPVDGSEYVRKDGDWVASTTSAGGAFLPLAGGTLTGDLILDNGPRKLILDNGGGSTIWLESVVHGGDATDAIWRIGSSTHAQIMNGSAKSQVVNFMAPPVCQGIPIVLKSDHDAAIAALEARLAALEARMR